MTAAPIRREAVDHVTSRLGGEVVVALPLKASIFGVLLITAVALAVAFAFSASFARKETVGGWLTLEGCLLRAAARRGRPLREKMTASALRRGAREQSYPEG